MGFFDKLVSNNDISGYKKFANKDGWDNKKLFELLREVKTSLGEPRMGTVWIMGKDIEAIIYPDVSDNMNVYVKADAKKIDIGSAPKEGAMEDSVEDAFFTGLSGTASEDGNRINRSIDEMQAVMEKLLAGESVTESKASTVDKSNAVHFYMEENYDFSLKDKFSITDDNRDIKYYVEGNLMDTAYRILDPSGAEKLIIKKKLISITPEYSVNEGRNEIGRFRKKLSLGRMEINGKLYEDELKIKGDMYSSSFDILLGDTVIGNVDKAQMIWGNCYDIAVFDGSRQTVAVAIAVVCEAIIRAEQRSN